MTLAVMAHMPYREVVEMDDRELATLDAVVRIMNDPKGGKGADRKGVGRKRHDPRSTRP